MKPMVSALIGAVAAMILLSYPANAQADRFDTASSLCGNPTEGPEIDASCDDAVNAVLAQIQANTDPNAVATDIADFVTALASNPLVSNPVCVRLAGQVTKLGDATPDAEQGVQIEGIAESLRLCQVVRTAAIAPLQISPF